MQPGFIRACSESPTFRPNCAWYRIFFQVFLSFFFSLNSFFFLLVTLSGYIEAFTSRFSLLVIIKQDAGRILLWYTWLRGCPKPLNDHNLLCYTYNLVARLSGTVLTAPTMLGTVMAKLSRISQFLFVFFRVPDTCSYFHFLSIFLRRLLEHFFCLFMTTRCCLLKVKISGFFLFSKKVSGLNIASVCMIKSFYCLLCCHFDS